MSRTAVQTAAAPAATASLALAIALTANWRLALLAAIAAVAIAATRVRYAPLGAILVTSAIFGLAAAGASAGTDQQPATAMADTRRCADVVRGGRRVDVLRVRGVSCTRAHRVVRAWLRAGAHRTIVRAFHCRGHERLVRRRHAAQVTGILAARRR